MTKMMIPLKRLGPLKCQLMLPTQELEGHPMTFFLINAKQQYSTYDKEFNVAFVISDIISFIRIL